MKWDLLKISLLCLIVLTLFYLLAQPINLTTADLGRHIKNGELILNGNSEILNKNLYSYTNSDFPFLNHHWGSGVIFNIVHEISGFAGLHLLYILLSILTFLIFFNIAQKFSNFYLASFVSLFALPLIGGREEIRPEVFSYLILGIIFWIIWNFLYGKLSQKWLFTIPLLMILWINLHIYFTFGILIIGIFLLEQTILYLFKRDKNILKNIKLLLLILICSLFALLINPAGLNGVLYPLQIFKSYGYRVFENQSVWFLERVTSFPDAFYFKIAFSILVLSWIYALYNFLKHKQPLALTLLFLTVIFSYLAWTAIRNFAIFGLFALVTISINLSPLKNLKLEGSNKYAAILGSLILILVLVMLNPKYWEAHQFGLGLAKDNEKSAQFFIQNDIKGPIMNNYDIGSYLIYYLYPKEKIFVDNRPEAYPKDFFEKVYIPMQEDENKWIEMDSKYNFNSIFFMRRDLTPWAQKFLIRMVKDKNWAPIYVDNYTIIFLKRNETNMDLIKKYELPKEIFKVS